MTNRFRAPLVLLAASALLAASCSSSDPAPPDRDRDGTAPPMMRPAGEEMRSRPEGLFPPANWWHSDDYTRTVTLDGDEVKRLDALQNDQGAEIARLERDLMLAVRDVKSALDAPQPADADITAAGDRLRQLRDSLLGRQLTMLAAERAILTADQWRALEDAMQASMRRRPDGAGRGQRPGGMGGRGGRRGGMGGGMGGRWPGGA